VRDSEEKGWKSPNIRIARTAGRSVLNAATTNSPT